MHPLAQSTIKKNAAVFADGWADGRIIRLITPMTAVTRNRQAPPGMIAVRVVAEATDTVISHARVFSDPPSEASIPDQQHACQAHVERQPGWALTQALADQSVSGAVRDRPGDQARLDGMRAGCRNWPSN